MSTVFKLVRSTRGAYRSVVMSETWREGYIGELDLIYAIGQRTKAPRGSMGILVFDTLEHARVFWNEIRVCYNVTILECSFTGKAIPVLYYPDMGLHLSFSKSHRRLHRHYRRGEIVSWINSNFVTPFNKVSSRDLNPAPKGSLSVESIIPFRTVE